MSSKQLKQKTQQEIDEHYQSKTLEEQILLRPDTYIGDTNVHKENMFVYCSKNEKIMKRMIDYCAGLYKIYDELLVNVRDNKINDELCTKLEILIDKKMGKITIRNNGKGIDIATHTKENMYIPEMIFSKFITSTNYDDTQKRIVGGRNGFGAKLTNLFSVLFELRVIDLSRGLEYKQTFKDNMTKRTEAIISKVKNCQDGLVEISFIPDYKRFNMENLTEDVYELFKKRAYDIAGTTPSLKVYFDGNKLEVKDFKTYIKLYRFNGQIEKEQMEDTKSMSSTQNNEENVDKRYELYYEKVNDRWEIGFMYAPENGNEQISFVNGIWTYNGGTHYEYIFNMVYDKLKSLVQKQFKDMVLRQAQIKDNMILFINSTIENPNFTSQSKDTLKTRVMDFGSKCEIDDKILTRFSKSGIFDQLTTILKVKEQSALEKISGKKTASIKVPKYNGANKAGTRESHKCKLILCEGDSASALAKAGLSAYEGGSDYIGVFPLKGKPLNVREATPTQVMNNSEVINIIKILGLDMKKKYDNINNLRYGTVVVMSDQDVDGIHIQGLLLNLFHMFWPSLLKIKGFITRLSTPIVKVFKNNETIEFYDVQEYEGWKKEMKNVNSWKIKYYKGLATSSSKEGKEYFTDMDNKLINYVDDSIMNKDENQDNLSNNNSNSLSEIIDIDEASTIKPKPKSKRISRKIIKEEDTDICSNMMSLAFNKDKADERKLWLQQYKAEETLSNNIKVVTVSDFINKSLIHFSYESVVRSVPSMVDGLKPSQRKVLYGCLKKNIDTADKTIKVSQLVGYISEKTCYHHGENSLVGTIIGMAQNFVGSNNINLLYPDGQFGTRLQGGDDAGASRYIFTYLEKLTKNILIDEDENVLKYLDDDGIEIEPEYFVPIVPLALINGVSGIGTGYSTTIPSYNIVDIIDNIIRYMNNEEMIDMNPYYRNFTGCIIKDNDKKYNRYITYGKLCKISDTEVKITELPIGVWTDKYKEFLDELEENKTIESYSMMISDIKVNITIVFTEEKLEEYMEKKELFEKLKLSSKIGMTNMNLIDASGKIKKYESPLEIIKDFYEVRYSYYVKRKEYLINKLTNELNLLNYKVKFINDYLNKIIIIEKQKKDTIINRLIELKYPKLEDDSYNYLLNIGLMSLSQEKIDELMNKYNIKKEELERTINTDEFTMWENELIELKNKYMEWYDLNDYSKMENIEETNKSNKNKKQTKRKGK